MDGYFFPLVVFAEFKLVQRQASWHLLGSSEIWDNVMSTGDFETMWCLLGNSEIFPSSNLPFFLLFLLRTPSRQDCLRFWVLLEVLIITRLLYTKPFYKGATQVSLGAYEWRKGMEWNDWRNRMSEEIVIPFFLPEECPFFPLKWMQSISFHWFPVLISLKWDGMEWNSLREQNAMWPLYANKTKRLFLFLWEGRCLSWNIVW